MAHPEWPIWRTRAPCGKRTNPIARWLPTSIDIGPDHRAIHSFFIPIPMTTSNPQGSPQAHPYKAQWSKLIAKAWTDPSFLAQFNSNPASVLLSYGIKTVQGNDVSTLAGKIKVTGQPSAWKQKPTLSNGVLLIPFPTPVKSYS